MAICTSRKYTKTILCLADLTHLATISERLIGGDVLDDTSQNNTMLLQVKQAYCAVKTKQGFIPVNGVNDGEAYTHIFSFRWADISPLEIDITRHVVTVGGVNYRILQVENINEQNLVYDLRCIARGADSGITRT